jgi:hypothetical protein
MTFNIFLIADSQRRDRAVFLISLVVVGGGPPCQGVSGLNASRTGALKDEGSCLFAQVDRIRCLVQNVFVGPKFEVSWRMSPPRIIQMRRSWDSHLDVMHGMSMRRGFLWLIDPVYIGLIESCMRPIRSSLGLPP